MTPELVSRLATLSRDLSRAAAFRWTAHRIHAHSATDVDAAKRQWPWTVVPQAPHPHRVVLAINPRAMILVPLCTEDAIAVAREWSRVTADHVAASAGARVRELAGTKVSDVDLDTLGRQVSSLADLLNDHVSGISTALTKPLFDVRGLEEASVIPHGFKVPVSVISPTSDAVLVLAQSAGSDSDVIHILNSVFADRVMESINTLKSLIQEACSKA